MSIQFFFSFPKIFRALFDILFMFHIAILIILFIAERLPKFSSEIRDAVLELWVYIEF